ncbi:MAG TPA: hypothetical protein DCZ10_08865, partial [Pelotomaculum sp.]|nr:hypothetical protein [Pelotomaculum sp.]
MSLIGNFSSVEEYVNSGQASYDNNITTLHRTFVEEGQSIDPEFHELALAASIRLNKYWSIIYPEYGADAEKQSEPGRMGDNSSNASALTQEEQSKAYGYDEMMADFALFAKYRGLIRAGIDIDSEQQSVFNAATQRLHLYNKRLEQSGLSIWNDWHEDDYINY